MKKKALSLILSLFLLSGMLPADISAAAVPEGPGWTDAGNYDENWLGGSYDSQTEWEIRDAEDLAAFSREVNQGKSFAGKTVSLKADINLGSYSWQPVGKNENLYFAGIFNGEGHTISHISVSSGDIAEAGLFGYCRGAVVKDLRLKHVSVRLSSSHYQSLAIGGVTGVLTDGEVSNCIVLGGVFDAEQELSFGFSHAAGIVGRCSGTGTVSHCVAQIDSVTAASQTHSFAGGITADETTAGVSITDCFFVLTGPASPAVTPVAEAQPISQEELESQDFLDSFNAGWHGMYWPLSSMEFILGGGKGTAESPYLIPDLETLEEFRDMVNGENGFSSPCLFPGEFLEITADIDLSPKYGEGELSWTPINKDGNDFTGILDGGGNTISGLYGDGAGFYGVGYGLFGQSSGTIKNLTVSGTFSGGPSTPLAGGIVGYNQGTIENCSSSVQLSGNSSLGGIAGFNEGIVKGCVNTGNVTGDTDSYNVGGIAGQNNGVVENCRNTGAVTGGSPAGGISGMQDDLTAFIRNCCNTGSVTGQTEVGGILGSSQGGKTLFCYSTGPVTGSRNAGGIAGYKNLSYVDSPNSIENCYFLKTSAVNSSLEAIGLSYGSGADFLFPKDETAFRLGEVAYLLQAAQDDPSRLSWGQDLISQEDREDKPVLTGEEPKRVLKVTFSTESNPEYAVAYTNPDGTVVLPADPPLPAGKSFAGWFSAAETPFTASTKVTTDIGLYAQWQEGSTPPPGGNPGITPGGETRRGLPYYVQNGEDIFIGFSVGEGESAKYIAPEGVGVLFRENPKTFQDSAEGWWGTAPIQFVTEREIFLGTSETTFSPCTSMTRAMFVAVLGRLYEKSYSLPGTESAPQFADADYESYYGKYLDWAAKSGIVKGVGKNQFAPNRSITRQEMAAMLYRFAKYLGRVPQENGDGLSYPDSGKIADWAREGALYCQQNGIILGREDGVFAPASTALRAETAAMLKRFITAFLK